VKGEGVGINGSESAVETLKSALGDHYGQAPHFGIRGRTGVFVERSDQYG